MILHLTTNVRIILDKNSLLTSLSWYHKVIKVIHSFTKTWLKFDNKTELLHTVSLVLFERAGLSYCWKKAHKGTFSFVSHMGKFNIFLSQFVLMEMSTTKKVIKIGFWWKTAPRTWILMGFCFQSLAATLLNQNSLSIVILRV